LSISPIRAIFLFVCIRNYSSLVFNSILL